LHLAKRYYDQAVTVDSAAKLPVMLALTSLWLRKNYADSFLVSLYVLCVIKFQVSYTIFTLSPSYFNLYSSLNLSWHTLFCALWLPLKHMESMFVTRFGSSFLDTLMVIGQFLVIILFKLYSMNSSPQSIKRLVGKACCVHLELSSVIIITKRLKLFTSNLESLQVALTFWTYWC